MACFRTMCCVSFVNCVTFEYVSVSLCTSKCLQVGLYGCVCLYVCLYMCVLCVSEKGFCVRGDLCEFDHGVDPVVIDDMLPGQPLPPHQPPSASAVPVTQTLSGSAFL